MHDHEDDGDPRPVVGGLSAQLVSSYAGLLGGINGALATGLRQMHKSFQQLHLRLIQGGKSDLIKADGVPKAPEVKAPTVPGEKGKIRHPGSRGGKWYRDDHGNVRYGTKPTARYHTGLTDEETAQLHANINASIAELSNTNLNKLAKVMDVDPSVLDTLRMVSQQAASQGLDPHECFAETYAESFGDPQDAEKLAEGHELYANMALAYKTAVDSDRWKQAAKISLAKQRQQAVNAARAVDRQRPIIKGHFDALMSGNIAHESIKGLAVMHDMGLFTLPKTLSEARTYTSDDEQARAMVGKASINGERLGAILKFSDALEAEQQTAMVAVAMLGEEQEIQQDDPLYDREAFWEGMKDNPGLDELKALLTAGGKQFSDAEWEQVKERTLQLARNVSDQMKAYNENQGGHIFKALFHNSTSLKKLFEDPTEVDRLHEVEAEVRTRVERALRAQTDYDHPLEQNITDAMKKIAGPNGDLFGFQKAAVAWMKEIKSGVLAYDAGLGKAQPLSSKVLTPAGFKRMGKIRVGDEVMGGNGKPTKVLAIFPQKTREVYRVRFSDGFSTKCHPDHMWHVFSTTQKRRNQHEVIDLREIMRRGLRTPNGRIRFMIPLTQPVQHQERHHPVPAYTLGVMLGDGNFGDMIQVSNDREEVAERMRQEVVGGVVLQSIVSPLGNRYSFRSSSRLIRNPYSKAIREMGLFGCRSHEKFIPKDYMLGSVEQRIALLQGLCDTDGFIDKSGACMQFYSTSKRLRDQFIRLVQSLGGLAIRSTKRDPSYSYRGEQRTGRHCYIATFNVPREIEPFTRHDRAERYALRHQRRPWGLSRAIVAIERVEDEACQCIKVANPDGLYITDHHIVTHNTPISIAFISHLLATKKAKRGIMVLPANLVAQWPKEIERFRPGSKVQVISADSGDIEDRLLKLRAINSGELEADFVILSAGTVGLHQDTQAAIETEAAALADQQGKKTISKEDRARLVQEGGFLENDPLVQELKNLDGAVIYDEAHHGGQGLKDPTNTHHQIARHILKDREYKFGMTATPMPDGPEDLFHLSNLFHPGSAGESMAKFNASLVKYEKTIDPDTGELRVVPVGRDMKSLAATKHAIAPYVFFQRKTGKKVTEEMAAKGMKLPHLNSVSHPLSLTPEARKMYDDCKEIGFDEGKEPLFPHPEGYLSDKEMHEKMLNEHGPKAAEMVMKMRGFIRQQRAAISPKLLDKNYTGPSPKIDASIDIIKRHFADPSNADKPVVIFGSWMDSLDLMHDELVKAGIPPHLMGKITGDVAVEDRDVVQDAVNAGKLKVVFIGIKAGGAGLNLQKKAYRNIFLDKPWTPADMEQAVGRTWRTGATSDTVHIHHMKVADTVDERKYLKLGQKIQLVDSLSFADQSEDYLGGMVGASLKRLVGSFDDTVQEWTPEQHAQMMQLAGLSKQDVPFPSIPALREQFDLQKFGEANKHEKWKETGDQKIHELATINDLKLKEGMITDKQHAVAKRKIGKLAAQWMKDAKAAADHPVAKYVGEDFDYGSEATNSIMGKREDYTPAKQPRAGKVDEKLLPPPLPISGKPKLTAKSQIILQGTGANGFEAGSPDWHFWEVLRRTRPTSVSDAVAEVANWLQAYSQASGQSIDKSEALYRVQYWLDERKTFEKLRAHGLLEVVSDITKSTRPVKYIKRERGPDGEWVYTYPDDEVAKLKQEAAPTKLAEHVRDALYAYQTGGFSLINALLRRSMRNQRAEDRTPERLADARMHTEALQALVQSSRLSEDTTVFRGVKLTPKRFGQIVAGGTFADPGFFSTSRSREQAESMWKRREGRGHNVLFELRVPKTQPALDMTRHSEMFREEQEVLLPHGTAFRVVSMKAVRVGRSKVIHVVLEIP